MLAPLIGGAVLGNLPRFGLNPIKAEYELWYLRAYFVFAIIVYFRWALLVINSICDYLGINCLTIPYPPPSITKKAEVAANGHSLNGVKYENAGNRKTYSASVEEVKEL